jgi:hypothetical protein
MSDEGKDQSRFQFKEIYCRDCAKVLARYSSKYFSEADIAELIHLHHSWHVKSGHAMQTRIVTQTS